MGFFDRAARQQTQQRPASQNPQGGMFGTSLPDPVSKVNEIERNPAMLSEAGFSIPQGMTDGEQILEHLINTRQVDPALLRNPLVRAAASALSARRH